MRKMSLMFGIGLILLVLTVAYTGYNFWQKSAVAAEMQRAEKAFVEVQNKVLQYESNDVEQAIAAKQTLAELSDSIVQWSKIIKEIRRTIPKDKKDRPLIEILSYSGSANNEISMNVKTAANTDEPYFDAADLIKAFNESEFFEDSFVPSISKGSDLEGASVLTFLFTTRYVEENISQKLSDGVSDPFIGETLSNVLDEALNDSDSKTVAPIAR